MRVLAFDVGGTSARGALLDELTVVRRVEQPTRRGPGVVDQLVALAAELGADEEVEAVGIGIPGPLSPDRGSIAFASNLDLRGFPIRDALAARLGVPVHVDDDANCAALAEARLGAAAGARSSVTITVGTGVGAGFVVDSRLYRGAHAVAGEIGHIHVSDEPRRCSCGRDGCLEAMANAAAVEAYAGPGFDGAPAVFAAAAAGDRRAIAAVTRVAGHLAVGVATVASLLDPERIVLAGGIGSSPFLADRVGAAAPDHCIPPLGDYLDVRPAALGTDAGLIGAGALVMMDVG